MIDIEWLMRRTDVMCETVTILTKIEKILSTAKKILIFRFHDIRDKTDNEDNLFDRMSKVNVW